MNKKGMKNNYTTNVSSTPGAISEQFQVFLDKQRWTWHHCVPNLVLSLSWSKRYMSPSSKWHIAWGRSFLHDATYHRKNICTSPEIHISWCQLVSGVEDLYHHVGVSKPKSRNCPVWICCLHRRQWDFDQPFTILLAFLGGILSLLRSEVSRNQTEKGWKRLYNIRSSYCNSFRAALRNEDDEGMNGWIDGQVHIDIWWYM